MKISVIGNIIDTKHIYRITPIEEIMLPIGMNGGNEYIFTIKMFNDMIDEKELDIRLSCRDYDSQKYILIFDIEDMCIRESEYYKLSKQTKQAVEILREKIVSYWSNNQLDIPKLEFNN
jgi:hypothetical protein